MERVYPCVVRSRAFVTPKRAVFLQYETGFSQICRHGSRSLSTGNDRKNAYTVQPTFDPPSTQNQVKTTDSPMSRLPTMTLIRSMILGYCFTSPRILSFSLRVMTKIVSSKSPFLNPDKNPVLGAILRAAVYNQFCAGTKPSEVRETVAQIKSIGYAGVILGYGREIVLSDAEKSVSQQEDSAAEDPYISAWLQGNLDTLDLISEGDYMNIKFTGAGKAVSQALIDGKSPPPQMAEAMDAIIQKAISQKSRVWVDAEQQIFHPTIDNWAMDLMRKFNRNGQAPVFNTIQAYLKSSRQNVLNHLEVAQSEGWTLGLKLVRGAYIQQDTRSAIWDTKSQTDTNYNTIARDLLSKSFDGHQNSTSTFPDLHLFLAGHNKESIQLASAHIQTLVRSGATLNPVGFGQLHGMADEVGCELITLYQTAQNEAVTAGADGERVLQGAPRVYKCLNWGSVQECMHFLMRRAVENASATERLKDGVGAARAELRRRFLGGWI